MLPDCPPYLLGVSIYLLAPPFSVVTSLPPQHLFSWHKSCSTLKSYYSHSLTRRCHMNFRYLLCSSFFLFASLSHAEMIGDLNGDNCFNYQDQLILQSRFGQQNAAFSLGDYNRDGRYNWQDLAYAKQQTPYQTCVTPGSASSSTGSTATALSPIIGDLNGDYCFNYQDQKILEQRFGTPNAKFELGDYNRDGVYNWSDLSVAKKHTPYQSCQKPSQPIAARPAVNPSSTTTKTISPTDPNMNMQGNSGNMSGSMGNGMSHSGHTKSMKIPQSSLPTGDAGKSGLHIGSTQTKAERSDQSAFRQSCDFTHFNYDDPIVYPNQPGASHLHLFFGNSGTNARSTVDTLINGASSCPGGSGANASSYWMPAMIGLDGLPITPDFSMMYYKQIFWMTPRNIETIPVGLKIIAGDHSVAPQPEHVVDWRCKRENDFSGNFRTIPETSCQPGDQLLVEISFPSCWDGKNLDSFNHRSHMAYPGLNGCPTTHPVQLPHMTMNIGYNITKANQTEYKKWKLSSDHDGQPGGSSTHADYWAAWNPDIQELWVNNCIRAQKDCRNGLLADGSNRILTR